MGTITGTTLITAVLTNTLQDPGAVKWSRAEMLGFINDAQAEICIAKPDAFSKNIVMQLVAGTKQPLPSDSNGFDRITCNMGVSGTARGRVPLYIPVDALDRQAPNWQAEAASNVVMMFTTYDNDKKRFYVSPPQPASSPGQAEIIYFAAPTVMTAEGQTIAVDDIWSTAIRKYMEYRAYSKDASYAREDAAALVAYKVFASIVGIKDKRDDEEKAAR